MKKVLLWALCCLASLAFLAGGAWGGMYCVSDAGSLQACLTEAEANEADDIIKVVQGTYNGHFSYPSTEGHSITLLGGYTPGTSCTERELDPAKTVLDGGGTANVLYLYNGGAIQVDGFTIKNGNSGGAAGGVYASTVAGGDVTLTNNIITGNIAGTYGGGVYAHSYLNSGAGGTITLTNNIITGNSAGDDGGGVYAYSETVSGVAGDVILTANTITGNYANTFGGGVWAVSEATGSGLAGAVFLTDNIIAENTAYSDCGGGVWAESYSDSGSAGRVTLINNMVTGNTAAMYGGGVFALSASDSGWANTITLTNNTITGNAVGADGGGGLDIIDLRINNGTVELFLLYYGA